MHKKYASQGLVAISVSLDANDPETRGKVLQFLRSKQAAITNLLLNDMVDFKEKLHFEAPPCYFVFNRRGKWVQFSGEEGPVDYRAMEDLVIQFLKER